MYSRGKKINRIHTYIYKKGFIMGIGPCNYGGWDMSCYALCKLENQETGWYNSIHILNIENQGSWWWAEAKDLKIEEKWGVCCWLSPQVGRLKNQQLSEDAATEDACPNSKRERIHPSSTILFYVGPQGIRKFPPNPIKLLNLLISCETLMGTPIRNIQK